MKNYYYVGGYYGSCNEDNILEELKKNGPLVVSMKLHPAFFSYSRGIFSYGSKKLLQNKEWQEVTHSVLLIGYGIDNGVEYWQIMNSWGDFWGENGFAKIKKGDNIMSIGSIGEAAEIELKEINA